MATHPSYHQDALAHIYPRVRVYMKEVCAIAEKLVTGNLSLLANEPKIMVNRPMEHLVPKPERVQWYALRDKDFGKITREIGESFTKFGVPFFQDYQTPEDIILGYERGDLRPRLQANWAIFVAAAYLYGGRATAAEEALRTAFDAPKSRKEYEVVFSNLKVI